MNLQAATQTAPNRLRQMVRGAIGRFVPSRWVLVHGMPASGEVCLTFDDGPDPIGTPRVLDILSRANVRGTFFLQGRNAAAHPAIVRRIHQEGHAIGHHSWHHSAPAVTTAAALADETVQTRALLEATTGTSSSLFRPPHGKLTAAKLLRLWWLGQTVVLWSADPGDVASGSCERILNWFSQFPPRAGDIILLHDKSTATVDALAAVIDLVRQRGLRFVTVPEWLTR